MLARAELQKCEAEDQTSRPNPEQRNHGERAEISEKSFAPGLRCDVACQSRPGNPGVAVEKVGNAELAANTTRERDGFKGVEEDRQNDQNAGDDGENVHWIKIKMISARE